MNNGVERVNIASPTSAAIQVVSVDAGDDGALISDDGTKVVMYNNGACGLRSVLPATGWTPGTGDGGCWPQMRAGSPIQFSHNNSGHSAIAMFNASGGSAGSLATSAALTTWVNADAANRNLGGSCQHDENDFATDGHRWTRDRDFVSFYCESSKMNPILWRASDNKWIYVEDNLSCTFCGDMDAVFGTWAITEVAHKASRQQARARGMQDAGSFSINGRLLSRSMKGVNCEAALKGIVIRQSADGLAARICR
jgi:hypothetical protein